MVGYIPTYRTDCLSYLDYSALTHVMASFLDPGSDAMFAASSSIKSIVSKAKAEGVAAFVAIGGGGADVSYWLDLMKADRAEATANAIVQSAMSLGADGIDVDLEGDLVLADSYNSFVAVLSSKAKANGLGLSAALAKWTCSKNIQDSTLALFDFVNLMAYDNKGPWDTNPPLQHSSYEVAQAELNYYINTRGLPGNKVALGVPFYGYDFQDTSNVQAFTWAQIVSQDPDQMDNDNFDQKYYNGKKTIYAKALLAKTFGAGVMIWELGQDVPPGPDSLLQQIKSAMISSVMV